MLRQIIAIAGAALLFALPASAQETVNVDVNAARINVEVNTARLIQLDRNADVVMIANPEIADVVLESARTIFLLGKQRGKTSLFILGVGGKVLMRSAIVVTTRGVTSEEDATLEVEMDIPRVVKVYRSVVVNRMNFN